MSSIISFIKSMKALADLIGVFVGMYDSYKIKKAEKIIKQINEGKKSLRTKIELEAKKGSPDEEAIKDLHRRITNISIEL